MDFVGIIPRPEKREAARLARLERQHVLLEQSLARLDARGPLPPRAPPPAHLVLEAPRKRSASDAEWQSSVPAAWRNAVMQSSAADATNAKFARCLAIEDIAPGNLLAIEDTTPGNLLAIEDTTPDNLHAIDNTTPDNLHAIDDTTLDNLHAIDTDHADQVDSAIDDPAAAGELWRDTTPTGTDIFASALAATNDTAAAANVLLNSKCGLSDSDFKLMMKTAGRWGSDSSSDDEFPYPCRGKGWTPIPMDARLGHGRAGPWSNGRPRRLCLRRPLRIMGPAPAGVALA